MTSTQLHSAMEVLEECRALSDSDQDATILWLARGILARLEDDVEFIEALQAQSEGRVA